MHLFNSKAQSNSGGRASSDVGHPGGLSVVKLTVETISHVMFNFARDNLLKIKYSI